MQLWVRLSVCFMKIRLCWVQVQFFGQFMYSNYGSSFLNARNASFRIAKLSVNSEVHCSVCENKPPLDSVHIIGTGCSIEWSVNWVWSRYILPYGTVHCAVYWQLWDHNELDQLSHLHNLTKNLHLNTEKPKLQKTHQKDKRKTALNVKSNKSKPNSAHFN